MFTLCTNNGLHFKYNLREFIYSNFDPQLFDFLNRFLIDWVSGIILKPYLFNSWALQFFSTLFWRSFKDCSWCHWWYWFDDLDVIKDPSFILTSCFKFRKIPWFVKIANPWMLWSPEFFELRYHLSQLAPNILTHSWWSIEEYWF